MRMNNSCSTCGQTPCQCHTACKAPVACITPSLSHRPKPQTTTVAGLLALIAAKCDDYTCQLIQTEVSLLFTLLGLEDYKVTHTIDELGVIRDELGNVVHDVSLINTDIHTIVDINGNFVDILGHIIQQAGTDFDRLTLADLAFQLISNITDTLEGDLTDKYPSAELLKTQLKALWSCIKDDHKHHGDWGSNFTMRQVTPSDELCLLDGDADNAPLAIKVFTPVDVGSTVFNYIDGRKCLFESLVNNNTDEPNKLSVLEGKWLNYCDMKDAIDCVLPRRIGSCHENCDDPNKDGVIEDKTMCERMEAVEAYMLAHP